MLRPATGRLFREAGIRPGTRVLDAGSGAGGVATRAEIDIDTLAALNRTEGDASDGASLGPIQGCAWTRVPN